MERDQLIPTAGRGRGSGTAGGWVRSLVGACCAFYLTVIATLAVWAIVPILAAGRLPVVIVSGSMRPAIEVGDLVIGAPHDGGALEQGQVVTFRDPARDRLVTHRIVEVLDDGTYRTRGDANRTADSRPVSATDIDHVPKLLVPMAGVPVLWASNGRYIELLAWLLATAAAVRVVAGTPYRPKHLRVPAKRPIPRLAAGAVVVLAATALAMRPSDAAFTAVSANVGNTITAGTVAAPANLSANCTLGVVNLTWTAVNGATEYEVRRTDPGGTEVDFPRTTSTSYADGSLLLGVISKTYTYRVQAFAGSWSSSQSSVSLSVSTLCL